MFEQAISLARIYRTYSCWFAYEQSIGSMLISHVTYVNNTGNFHPLPFLLEYTFPDVHVNG